MLPHHRLRARSGVPIPNEVVAGLAQEQERAWRALWLAEAYEAAGLRGRLYSGDVADAAAGPGPGPDVADWQRAECERRRWLELCEGHAIRGILAAAGSQAAAAVGREGAARLALVAAENLERKACFWAIILRQKAIRLALLLRSREAVERAGVVAGEASARGLLDEAHDQVDSLLEDPLSRLQNFFRPAAPAAPTVGSLTEGLKDPVCGGAVHVYTACAFRYRQHCALPGESWVSAEQLQAVHFRGKEDAPIETECARFAAGSRRTRLQRLQARFRAARPVRLAAPCFMFPVAPAAVAVFDVADRSLLPFGGLRHGRGLRFGRSGKQAYLHGSTAFVVGTRDGAVWVTERDDDIAVPIQARLFFHFSSLLCLSLFTEPP
ncbi:hypothetical protein DIPPA_11849 [Diplonema papillatum]|nr:hypothetical protein DIPPA_11849 [Diplonema papillatum]